MTFTLSRAEQLALSLERQLALVLDAPPEEVLLETFRLLEVAWQEPILRPYLMDMKREADGVWHEYSEAEKPLLLEARQLLDQLYALEPSFQKPAATADPASLTYEYSLACAEDLLSGIHRVIWKVPLDDAKDHSTGQRVFQAGWNGMMRNTKVKEGFESGEGDIFQVGLGWRQAREKRELVFRRQMNRFKVHPGRGLAVLAGFYAVAYPDTPRATTWAEYVRLATSPAMHDWNRVNTALSDQPDPEFNALIHRLIRRVVGDLRGRIGRTASMLELIHRFRTRAMWFDKARLRQVAQEMLEGQRHNPVEDELTRELALYLFDQGHPVLVKADIENVQLDLLGFTNPLVVEAKAYSDGHKRTRTDLIRGIAQLHAYMVALEASSLHVEEAYYVVFRLAGPIFEFPSQVRTNRFTIYPVIVDIGESAVSGRRQPNPSIISPEELEAALEED